MKKTPVKSTDSDDIEGQFGELSTVKHHRLSTVHPNVILRTPVFTPIGRRSNAVTPGRTEDITAMTRDLAIVRAEGYNQVLISGVRLDIETDFRVWCGITKVLERGDFDAKGVTISFREFAALCSYPSKRLTTVLRERIERSLRKIMTQVISFKGDDGKYMMTHLIQKADYQPNDDVIRLTPDKDLWELYKIDHKIILNIEHQDALRGREVAQCLYVFIAALPANPAPISFERLRARLQLTATKVAEINRSITNGLAELKAIGYLDYEILPKNGERYVIVHERRNVKEINPK